MSNQLSPLEQFVETKTRINKLKPAEIHTLLEQNGLKLVSLARIYQIQEKLGLREKKSNQ